MKRLAASTIFVGSFLSFGVQPLVGRTLLPAFGGMASVWVTCLAAFQVLLIGGYWWGHWIVKSLEFRVKSLEFGVERSGFRVPGSGTKGLGAIKWHLALLLAAAGWIAGVAVGHGKIVAWTADAGVPALGALGAVALLVGVPYLLLCANASLVQVLAGGSYRLYAVSNAGSFAGLLAYPLLFELFLSVTAQWLLLAALTVVYAGMLWKLRVESSGLRVEGVGGFISRRDAEAQSGVCGEDFSPAEGAEAQSGVGGNLSPAEAQRRREIFRGCDFARRTAGDFSVSGSGVKPQLKENHPPRLCASAGDKREAESAEGCDGNGASLSTQNPEPETRNPKLETRNFKLETLLWLALPAAGCLLLNAVTAHLTSNVAPIPLMWVVLLGLYLASYIVGFSAWGERLLPLWLALGYVSALAAAWAIAVGHDSVVRFRWNVALVPACLFFGCTALHAWLCRTRPEAGRLTRFNLCLALGGAAGGVASGLAAPLLFGWPVEYPVALVAVAGLCVAGMRRGAGALGGRGPWWWPWAAAGAVLAMVGLREVQERQGLLAEGRTFYGAWRVGTDTVTNQHGKRYEMYTFKHGGTTHGYEPVEEVYRDGNGTSYYGPETAGMLFGIARGGDTNRTLDVGIVGLGIGTMACYGRPGDRIRFYEICPQVIDVAKNGPWFDFMRKSAADVEVKQGDARKTLEAERARGAERYDVLAVDAYSGDSIPMHLVTKEAFELYAGRLKAGGILALHISNWNIDLLPVVKAAAKHLGWEIDVVATQGGVFTLPASWAFVSERRLTFPAGTYRLNMGEVREAALPSDAKGSLLPFVNWGLE